MNSLKLELERRKISLMLENGNAIDIRKKCADIEYVMDEWFKRLQKRGDKEAFVDSIDELSKKISELKSDAKSNVSEANDILYVPDMVKFQYIVDSGLDDIMDDIISYMKSLNRYYSMSSSEKEEFVKKPDKIESKMDDFDRNVDNCFVTKRPMSVSGYLVLSDDLVDLIDSIMSATLTSLLELAKFHCTKYVDSIGDEFTRADINNVESVFKLIRSYFGSVRICIGKCYGNMCTNIQKIHDMFNE